MVRSQLNKISFSSGKAFRNQEKFLNIKFKKTNKKNEKNLKKFNTKQIKHKIFHGQESAQ